MKTLLVIVLTFAATLCTAAAQSIPATGFYVDLYGNVYKDGQNTNQQLGDYLVNHPSSAPALDGAWRAAAVRGREKIAADISAAQEASAAAIAANANELAAAKTAIVALTAERDATRVDLQTEKIARAADVSTRDAIIAARDAQLATAGEYIAALQKKIRDLGGEVPPAPSN